ncbi:MAG: PAS domain S-box protein [Bacteroidota bacterium]
MRKAKNESNALNLRQKAEELLKNKSAENRGQLSEVETLKLIHELEVHQIELEMQNDELRQGREVAEITSDKYTKFYDFSPTGYLSFSKEGKITELNLIAAQLLGKERPQLQGAQFGFFVSDDTRPTFNQFLDKVFNFRNTKETCELILLQKGNPTVFVQLTGITASNGEDCLVSLNDITARKQSEMELRESEENFRSMFEKSSSAMAIIEPDTTISMVNEEYCKLSGYTKQEIIGMSWTQQIPPEDLERLKEYNRRRLINPKDAPEKYEFTFHHKDGRIRHALMSVAMVGNRKIVASFVDITARKLAEDNLKEVSARLQLATRAGGVGVWDYDVVNNVLVWDDQMFKLYGISKHDFKGAYEAWLDGVHPEDKERGDSEIQMAISGVKEFNTEFRVVWQDGTIHFIRALAVVQKNDIGKPIKMIGTNWDITAQKNAEQSLREMNAEKDKLFSIISHDLRSPFNVFLNYTQMLEQELPTMTHEQIQKFVHLMGISANNLFRLLENLLEWSRLQRDLTKIHPKSFQLMPNVKSSMDSVRDAAYKKDIDLSYDIPEDMEVFADEYMLDSILRNLTTNAVKFTTKGGKVAISAKSIPDGWVDVSVKDTGIGISKKMIDNLFKMDVNTSRKGTDGEPSTGLGLILCKDFVEKHGGKLWVESEEGKGSTFYFTLPSKA